MYVEGQYLQHMLHHYYLPNLSSSSPFTPFTLTTNPTEVAVAAAAQPL